MPVAKYGGSYRAAPSFTSRSPRLPANTNVNTATNLGTLTPGTYTQSGTCGRVTGGATLFWRFKTSQPARIGLKLTPINKHTDDDVDINLSRVDGKQGLYSGERWFYQRLAGAIQKGDSAGLIDPGEFVIAVSAYSFHALPFTWVLEIRPAVEPPVPLPLNLSLKARFNQAIAGAALPLLLSLKARFLSDHKLGSAIDVNYVQPGYWEEGYVFSPESIPGRTVGPRMEFFVKTSIEVITPTTL